MKLTATAVMKSMLTNQKKPLVRFNENVSHINFNTKEKNLQLQKIV